MQNKENIVIINDLIKGLESSLQIYTDDKECYFDYDTVIELLLKAKETMCETFRCPRPKDLPSDVSWCESDKEFEPFVYRGDMSIDDFEKTQDKYLKDLK